MNVDEVITTEGYARRFPQSAPSSYIQPPQQQQQQRFPAVPANATAAPVTQQQHQPLESMTENVGQAATAAAAGQHHHNLQHAQALNTRAALSTSMPSLSHRAQSPMMPQRQPAVFRHTATAAAAASSSSSSNVSSAYNSPLSGSSSANDLFNQQQQQQAYSVDVPPPSDRYPAITYYRYASKGSADPLVIDPATNLGAFKCMHGLDILHTWIDTHILAPLAQPALFGESRVPQRIAAFNSRVKSGVSRAFMLVCEELRLDLFVVNSTFYDRGMINAMVEYSVTHRCVVLFDRCDAWFTPEYYMSNGSEFVGSLRYQHNQHEATRCMRQPTVRCLFAASQPTLPGDSWIVFSFSTPFQGLHPHMREIMRGRFYDIGAITYADAMMIMYQYYAYRMMDMGIQNEQEQMARLQQSFEVHMKACATLMTKTTAGHVIDLLEYARSSMNQACDRRGAPQGDLARLPTYEQVSALHVQFEGPPTQQEQAHHFVHSAAAATMASNLYQQQLQQQQQQQDQQYQQQLHHHQQQRQQQRHQPQQPLPPTQKLPVRHAMHPPATRSHTQPNMQARAAAAASAAIASPLRSDSPPLDMDDDAQAFISPTSPSYVRSVKDTVYTSLL
jgi:hypothetical protein